MMRSMFSGVSGLRSHQTRMDVIGNNIANVNTVGFKSGRVTFQEIFSQTIRGAGSPDSATGRGGVNPMQIGLGIGVGSVDTIMTRGSSQRTDNPTDLSIEGEGFFIVKGGNADAYKFTRAGNFGIDRLGNLVTGSGFNVMGWQQYTSNGDGTYEFDTEQELEAINLYEKRLINPRASTKAIFTGNLDAATKKASGSNYQITVPMRVYDSLGNDYTVNLKFMKTDATASSSTWAFKVDGGSQSSAPSAPFTIKFDKAGKIVSTASGAGTQFSVDLTPVGTVGTGTFNVKIDLSKLTMYAADTSVKPLDVDGYPSGELVTFNVGTDGMITGIYSNGQQQPLGMVALASFENPAGLQKMGDNLYTPTVNSGEFRRAVKAGHNGTGTLNPGTLEMSNVDLSREFTDMIITQRGFQANSRIITTSDEMLQELVNLKR